MEFDSESSGEDEFVFVDDDDDDDEEMRVADEDEEVLDLRSLTASYRQKGYGKHKLKYVCI